MIRGVSPYEELDPPLFPGFYDLFDVVGGLHYGMKDSVPHSGGWSPSLAHGVNFSFAGPDLRGGDTWWFRWWYVGGYYQAMYKYDPQDQKWHPVRVENVFVPGGGKSGGGGATRDWSHPYDGPSPRGNNDEEFVNVPESDDGGSDTYWDRQMEQAIDEANNWTNTASDSPDDAQSSHNVIPETHIPLGDSEIVLPTANPTETWIVDGKDAYGSLGEHATYNDSLGRWEIDNGASNDNYQMYVILNAMGESETWQNLPVSGYNPPEDDADEAPLTAELGLEDSEDLSDDEFYGNTPEE